MARVSENWDGLVRATLQREQLRSAGHAVSAGKSTVGLAAAVPPSIGKQTNIDAILQAADDIEDEDECRQDIYGFSWAVLFGIVMIFKVFTFSPKKSTKFQLMLLFIQGVTPLGLIAAMFLFVAFTRLSIPHLFASLLAFIPTDWAILCFSITWERFVRSLGLWDWVREVSRMYEAGMGMIIFVPIAVLSWFPFVSTFQSRLLFNQAFSRGLEISLILAGNKANIQS